MQFKLIQAGPFYGLPAIHVAPREIGGSLSIAEATAKIGKAEAAFGLTEGKKFIVLTEVEEAPYEIILPAIRLLREHGYFVIGQGSSQKCAAVAPELNAYVAQHWPSYPDTWLNYKCSGFVIYDMESKPVFRSEYRGIPKFISGTGSGAEAMAYCKNSDYAWAYQEMIDPMEVSI